MILLNFSFIVNANLIRIIIIIYTEFPFDFALTNDYKKNKKFLRYLRPKNDLRSCK
ncbi:hypothetical protein HanPSC8_Chr13g0555711 [Helianthus annuus]|nr:hypothetical protein HanPSC8_Chr13g0555711 [Helianthus annuus]